LLALVRAATATTTRSPGCCSALSSPLAIPLALSAERRQAERAQQLRIGCRVGARST
jgi:hypothetical protein